MGYVYQLVWLARRYRRFHLLMSLIPICLTQPHPILYILYVLWNIESIETALTATRSCRMARMAWSAGWASSRPPSRAPATAACASCRPTRAPCLCRGDSEIESVIVWLHCITSFSFVTSYMVRFLARSFWSKSQGIALKTMYWCDIGTRLKAWGFGYSKF